MDLTYMEQNNLVMGTECVKGNGNKMKPKDIEEVEKFIFDRLKAKYGDNVLSKKPASTIVIDTETKYHGNSDVWIKMNYFY